MKSLAHFIRDVAHAITRALVTDKAVDLNEARAIANAAQCPDEVPAPDEFPWPARGASAIEFAAALDAWKDLTDERIAARIKEWSA